MAHTIPIIKSVLVFLALTGLSTTAALRSTLWRWSYSGAGINASGTFTVEDSPGTDGGYLITGITGTRNGKSITGLQPTGTPIPGNEPYNVDNLVFLGPAAQLSSHGFGFSLSDGTYSNPFYADFLPMPSFLEFFSAPPFTDGTPGPEDSELPIQFSAAPVPVPEPSTVLLAAGALAVFVRLRQAR